MATSTNAATPPLDRPTLERSLSALSSFTSSFEAYKHALIALSKAQLRLASSAREVADGFGHKVKEGARDRLVFGALGNASAVLESLAEVDGKMAKQAEKDYVALNDQLAKYFKKTAKAERDHDSSTSTLESKLKKATLTYERSTASLDSVGQSKSLAVLNTLSTQLTAARAEHMSSMASSRLTVSKSVGRTLSLLAYGTWKARVDGVRKSAEKGRVTTALEAGEVWLALPFEGGEGTALWEKVTPEEEEYEEEKRLKGPRRMPPAPVVQAQEDLNGNVNDGRGNHVGDRYHTLHPVSSPQQSQSHSAEESSYTSSSVSQAQQMHQQQPTRQHHLELPPPSSSQGTAQRQRHSSAPSSTRGGGGEVSPRVSPSTSPLPSPTRELSLAQLVERERAEEQERRLSNSLAVAAAASASGGDNESIRSGASGSSAQRRIAPRGFVIEEEEEEEDDLGAGGGRVASDESAPVLQEQEPEQEQSILSSSPSQQSQLGGTNLRRTETTESERSFVRRMKERYAVEKEMRLEAAQAGAVHIPSNTPPVRRQSSARISNLAQRFDLPRKPAPALDGNEDAEEWLRDKGGRRRRSSFDSAELGRINSLELAEGRNLKMSSYQRGPLPLPPPAGSSSFRTSSHQQQSPLGVNSLLSNTSHTRDEPHPSICGCETCSTKHYGTSSRSRPATATSPTSPDSPEGPATYRVGRRIDDDAWILKRSAMANLNQGGESTAAYAASGATSGKGSKRPFSERRVSLPAIFGGGGRK